MRVGPDPAGRLPAAFTAAGTSSFTEFVGAHAPDEVLRTFGSRLTRALPLDELLLQLAESLKATMNLEVAEVARHDDAFGGIDDGRRTRRILGVREPAGRGFPGAVEQPRED